MIFFRIHVCNCILSDILVRPVGVLQYKHWQIWPKTRNPFHIPYCPYHSLYKFLSSSPVAVFVPGEASSAPVPTDGRRAATSTQTLQQQREQPGARRRWRQQWRAAIAADATSFPQSQVCALITRGHFLVQSFKSKKSMYIDNTTVQ